VLLPPLEGEAGGAPARAKPGALPVAQLDGRVLVVEDERQVGAFVADLLRHWGLEVEVVGTPAAALTRFEADPMAVDLVLTDQTMPGMTGVELARRLTVLRPGLPIILYTGYGEGLSETMLQASGIRGVVKKPIDPREMFALLDAALAGKEKMPAATGS